MRNNLPESISDTSFKALEKCIDKAFDIDMSPFMSAVIDKLSENLLYFKGEQMSLTDGDGWANCTTSAEKRNLIKQAFRQHKIKATVKCIKSLLTNEFTFTPWNEYNGVHNHYRLVINLDDSELTPTKISKIITVIANNKRLSAKQDDYEVCTTTKAPLNIASRFKTTITVNALPISE